MRLLSAGLRKILSGQRIGRTDLVSEGSQRGDGRVPGINESKDIRIHFHSHEGTPFSICLSEMMAGLLFGIGRWLKTERTHSLEADRTAISYHYDQPVGFYKMWPGELLAHSSAYFEPEDEDIDVVQTNKFELICGKFRLALCENFFDIGCGLGSLILHAASWRYAARRSARKTCFASP